MRLISPASLASFFLHAILRSVWFDEIRGSHLNKMDQSKTPRTFMCGRRCSECEEKLPGTNIKQVKEDGGVCLAKYVIKVPRLPRKLKSKTVIFFNALTLLCQTVTPYTLHPDLKP